jgi:hypothetical protein
MPLSKCFVISSLRRLDYKNSTEDRNREQDRGLNSDVNSFDSYHVCVRSQPPARGVHLRCVVPYQTIWQARTNQSQHTILRRLRKQHICRNKKKQGAS